MAAGCGAERPEREKAREGAQTRSETTAEPIETAPTRGDTSFGILFAQHGDTEKTPVRGLYGVFRRPASARDGPARKWADEESRYQQDGSAPIADEARVLLPDAGLDGGDLVAAPAGEHTVCVAITPMGPGGCGSPTTHGLDIQGDIRWPDMLVYGLVGDEVRAVEIVAAGKKCEARRGENSYACAFRDVSSDRLERIVLHLSDGSTETIELGG